MTQEKTGWHSITIATYKKYIDYLENDNGETTPQQTACRMSAILSILTDLPVEAMNELTLSQRQTLLSTYSFLGTPHEPAPLKADSEIYKIMLGSDKFCINPEDIRGVEWEAFETYLKTGDQFTAIAYLLRNEAAYDGLKYDFEAEDKTHTEAMVNEHMSVGDALDLSFFLQSRFLNRTAAFLKSLRRQIIRERLIHPNRWRKALQSFKKAGSTPTLK